MDTYHIRIVFILYRVLWMICKILYVQCALVCQAVMDLIGWGVIAFRFMNMVDPCHVSAVTAFNWGFHYFISHVPSYSCFVIYILWFVLKDGMEGYPKELLVMDGYSIRWYFNRYNMDMCAELHAKFKERIKRWKGEKGGRML